MTAMEHEHHHEEEENPKVRIVKIAVAALLLGVAVIIEKHTLFATTITLCIGINLKFRAVAIFQCFKNFAISI